MIDREREEGNVTELEGVGAPELKKVEDTEMGAGESERVLGSLKGPESVGLGRELGVSLSLSLVVGLAMSVGEEPVAAVEGVAEPEDAESFSIVNVGPLLPESPNTGRAVYEHHMLGHMGMWIVYLQTRKYFPVGTLGATTSTEPLRIEKFAARGAPGAIVSILSMLQTL